MRNNLIGNLASAGVAAALVLAASPLRADDTALRPGHAVALDNPLAVHPLDEFSATRDRPLFTRGRRPPAIAHAAVVVAPPPPPPPPKLALFGILIEGGEASAVVRGAPSDKSLRVHVGEEIDGWKITQIAARQIELSQGDRSVTFTMFDATHQGTPVALNRLPPVLEVNAAGVLRAHRVTRVHN